MIVDVLVEMLFNCNGLFGFWQIKKNVLKIGWDKVVKFFKNDQFKSNQASNITSSIMVI
jgi:hypothetical protein